MLNSVIVDICYISNKLMRFALEVWGRDYDKIKQTCIEAERLGYNAFYYGEALADLDLDCFTVISALSALTDNIRLGPVITYILPTYRSIALLAKMSITLQEISNNRFDFRTGGGATLQYAEEWWHPYGIEYPNSSERISILEEGLNVLKTLWSNGSINFKGRYFRLNTTMPKPTSNIPITISAKGKRMLKIAGKYADIWESSYLSPKKFKEINEQSSIDKKIERSLEVDVIIAKNIDELEYKKRQFAMMYGPNVLHHATKYSLIGTPEMIVERVNEYKRVRVDQLLLAFQDPFDLNTLRLFIEAVR